jgi:DNA-binding beta-propeller fold protein YncE
VNVQFTREALSLGLRPLLGVRQTPFKGHPHTSIPASRRGTLVYVSDFNANSIVVLSTEGKQVGSITDGIDGPAGSYVDGGGTLYVANYENSTVSEYPKGATSPSVILSKGIKHPISVAVGSDGTTYVGEFAENRVLRFPHGRTSPNAKITSLTDPEGLAIDANENLYVAWNEIDLAGRVDDFARSSRTGKNLGIATGQTGDVKIDSSGDLVLADQVNQVINVYKPGSSSPFRQIHTIGSDPYKFAFDRSEAKLYVADPDTGMILVFSYATGAQIDTFYKGLTSALGVSVSPAAPL